MGVWSAATSQLLGVLLADCTPITFMSTMLRYAHDVRRFAFVEYESRRDADDAYHEMHNKRLGRDDILKIEVRIGL